MDNPKLNQDLNDEYLTNSRDRETSIADANVATGTGTPAVDETHKGKHVFSPNELNQSGEDKEYFHPKDGHKFHVPKDANNHALTPDVELSPGNKVGKV